MKLDKETTVTNSNRNYRKRNYLDPLENDANTMGNCLIYSQSTKVQYFDPVNT